MLYDYTVLLHKRLIKGMNNGSSNSNGSGLGDRDGNGGTFNLVRSTATTGDMLLCQSEEDLEPLQEKFAGNDECNEWYPVSEKTIVGKKLEEIEVPDLSSYFDSFPNIDVDGRINVCRSYASHLAASIKAVKRRKRE